MLKAKTAYAYNAGSEWEENGVEYYHTFFRKYDAQIGRFTGVDIASEEYTGLTPFQFGANNPIIFNDPMGDRPEINPAQFKDVNSLLKHIKENGISDMPYEFMFWGFEASGGSGGNGLLSFGYGNEYSIGQNKEGETGLWFNWHGTYCTGAEGDFGEWITLTGLIFGNKFIAARTLWNSALQYGERNNNISINFMGQSQSRDVMWQHNYKVFLDRTYRGVSLQSSGDRASYDRQLPSFKSYYARYKDGRRFEATMVGIFAAPFVAGAAFEAGVVSGTAALYNSVATILNGASLNAGILINSAKNLLVSGFVNELGLYTSASIVTTLGNAGYNYTVTGGNLVGALYSIGGLFSTLPTGGKYLIPILPH